MNEIFLNESLLSQMVGNFFLKGIKSSDLNLNYNFDNLLVRKVRNIMESIENQVEDFD